MKSIYTPSNRIKELRKGKNLSQEEVATSLHKSPSAYSRMENGETAISLQDAIELSRILECKVEELIEPANNSLCQNNEHNRDHSNNQPIAASNIETINNNGDRSNDGLLKLMEVFIKKQEETEQRFLKTLDLLQSTLHAFTEKK